MLNIKIDFGTETGRIKPMHAVNNGPFYSVRGNDTTKGFMDAGIPYARNHDGAFSTSYGGSHAIDVLNIFTDFDADENDPENYDFILTDITCRNCFNAGVKVYYRLGSKIEHEYKKYQTQVPKDYAKYARICEHIIRHYCYGWADGFHMDIRYWEIWNEPDCSNPDGSNPCWQGTDEQFLQFYEVMAKHLKGCFPDLMIGGPALTRSTKDHEWPEKFIQYMREHEVPLDFYSWHGYYTEPEKYAESAFYSRKLLDDYGFSGTELILNEWNYIRGWLGEDIKESYRTMANEKGAAFDAACMLCVEKTPLDMFMYYDARPNCAYNGLFEPFTYDIRKPYFAFWQFNKLYRLGTEVKSCSEKPVYAGAAKKGDVMAAQIVYYSNETDASAERLAIELCGLPGNVKCDIYVVDKNRSNELTRTEYFSGQNGTVYIDAEPNSVMYLEMTKNY